MIILRDTEHPRKDYRSVTWSDFNALCAPYPGRGMLAYALTVDPLRRA